MATIIDIFEGLNVIDAGGTISADGMTSKSQCDQLELMQAMIAMQQDREIVAWIEAAAEEATNANTSR